LTRIGIDGIDGAGKTRLAEELAQALMARRRQAVRITLDRSSS
jgi:thymidylate kinase